MIANTIYLNQMSSWDGVTERPNLGFRIHVHAISSDLIYRYTRYNNLLGKYYLQMYDMLPCNIYFGGWECMELHPSSNKLPPENLKYDELTFI